MRAEQRQKKSKEAERARALKLEEGQSSDTSSMTDATGGSESPIELESIGDADEPIVINCQYPTVPSSHRHDPAPRSTVPGPSARTSFAPHGFLPPPPTPQLPQYHFNQFLTNHDHSAAAETVDDRLFVAQPPPSGMGDAAVAPYRGYSYPHY
jgi:hypothetical protein